VVSRADVGRELRLTVTTVLVIRNARAVDAQLLMEQVFVSGCQQLGHAVKLCVSVRVGQGGTVENVAGCDVATDLRFGNKLGQETVCKRCRARSCRIVNTAPCSFQAKEAAGFYRGSVRR